MAKALTDFAIKNTKAEAGRREIAAGARGLYLVVQPSGVKSFAVRYRIRGRPQKLTLGRWQSPSDIAAMKGSPDPKIGEPLSLASARKLAADTLLQVERGIDPAKARAAVPLTVEDMLDRFVDRYCRKEKQLRSADLIDAAFKNHVLPEIGDVDIYELKRSEVADMLDNVADEAGPVAADRTLAYFRKACNWQATRDDNFKSPIVPGMARGDAEARTRVLNDDEIRDLWTALDEIAEPACYSPFIKSMLLCATRRNESARMHSSEIEGDLWTIPGERYKRLPKHKGCDHVIVLTDAARALIGNKPVGNRSNAWFVFSTTNGEKPFSGFTKIKRRLDQAVADVRGREGRHPMPPWRLHDIRRTARTLMSRAGVPADHAERCLGHIIGGVRGVYDRHEFLEEKEGGVCGAFRLNSAHRQRALIWPIFEKDLQALICLSLTKVIRYSLFRSSAAIRHRRSLRIVSPYRAAGLSNRVAGQTRLIAHLRLRPRGIQEIAASGLGRFLAPHHPCTRAKARMNRAVQMTIAELRPPRDPEHVTRDADRMMQASSVAARYDISVRTLDRWLQKTHLRISPTCPTHARRRRSRLITFLATR